MIDRLFRRIVLAAALLPWVPGQVEAQAPLFLVNHDTRVASVGFAFPGGQAIGEDQLRKEIVLRGPTAAQRIRGALDFLPLVSSPHLQPFSPPDLFRDRIRLTRYLRNEGFPEAQVDYRVTLDTVPNTVDVTFVVHEGQPLVLDSVEVMDEGGGRLVQALPPEIQGGWPRLQRRLSQSNGERLSSSLRLRLQDQVAGWLQDRGFPFPRVQSEAEAEAHRGATRVTLTVRLGPRARVGEITVQGNQRLGTAVLRREVPIQPGDWYSRAELVSGQTQLMGLDMVRLAVMRTREVQGQDSLVNVQVQVDEGRLHLLSGQVGYDLQAGISSDASWSHRDFLGGARVLEVTGQAETGLFGAQTPVIKRYGLSVLLRQPYFYDRRLEGLLRPFVDYRDDLRDNSVETGTDASVLFTRGPNRHITLRYSLSYRRILNAKSAAPFGEGQDLASLLLAVDSLNLNHRTSSLLLSSQWGRPVDMQRHRRGWSLSGSAEIAGPPGLSTVQYGKLLAGASGDLPMSGGLLLSGRAGAGRVFPYGASVPRPDGSNRLEVFLELRDATLTAGGAQDVRGWGPELLGPKVPDLTTPGDSTVGARGSYIPLGGLARWTASLQFGVPFPFVGRPHGVHVFLDAGRVWTPDRRYLPPDRTLIPGQAGGRARFGTGAGVLFATPVGPLQIDLGFKINPSVLDVRDPRRVVKALQAGQPVQSVAPTPLRRWHLHFSIGR